MQVLALSLYLWMSTSAFAVTWREGALTFGAPQELYSSSPATFKKHSQDIAQQIKSLKTTYFPNFKGEVVITFETTRDVDALFFPPGTYDGSVSDIDPGASIIALNPRLFGNQQLPRLLGHEFFHVVHHELAPYELDWIKEGLAQKFEYDVFGGINLTNVRSAISGSRRALEESFDTTQVSSERYGNTFLFFHHWEKQCGVKNLWKSFLVPAQEQTGRAMIDFVLREQSSSHLDCVNAQALMTSFVLAKLTNQRSTYFNSVLWPELSPMAGMSNVALSLSKLSAKDEKLFFTQLPAFLGLKLPAGIWKPKTSVGTLSGLGVMAYVWDTTPVKPTLRLWNGEELINSPKVFLLFLKNR